ncbi:Galactosyl transferase [Artemisia annua]|uniref:Galactosyl transferase n=1 Tax=Artemisia annua TaxID=35608 RepID=A0A2U1L5D8_ARTAN|nr:Galactosyl transferase [Artemisia annua]
MLDRIIGTRRTRQIQRVLRNGKVTILCLVLTIVVLRGNLGAGKFGTPEQDFNEIRETFYSYRSRRAEPRRVLEELPLTGQTEVNEVKENVGSNNYNEFDINKLFVDEEDDVKKDPSAKYSIGPKIDNWDEQRGEWLSRNKDFPSFLNVNKPRVLLVP